MEIRRVRAGEGARLREIRLRALAEAPYAFASTLAETGERPTEHWEERAQKYEAAEREVMLVAVQGDEWCGLVGGYFSEEQPDTPELFSMWVAPAWRRSGVGLALVEAVVEWARERGATEIALWVIEGNDGARSFYERAGFVDGGEGPVRWDDEGPAATRMRRGVY